MMGRLARFFATRTEPPVFGSPNDATDDVVLLGEEAERILASPVLALAFRRIDDKVIGAIRNSRPIDTEAREDAYRLHWAVERLKTELRQMAGNAKIRLAERQRAR